MQNRILSWLILSALLALFVSGAATAATVKWHPGESSPPTQVSPASPNQFDTVSFTAATPPFLYRFTNSCFAENALGTPIIAENLAAHEFIVEFTPAPNPPGFCSLFYAPVNGIEGDLGPLEPGNWTLIITNVNNPFMDVTLPFSVTLVSSMAAELVLHTRGNDQTTGSTFPFDVPYFIARPLGQHCNPANGGVSCGATTIQEGVPLSGLGAASLNTGFSPPGFQLPLSTLMATATGSLPPQTPYAYISTYATNARNDHGIFAPGFGPGKRTFTFPASGGPAARSPSLRAQTNSAAPCGCWVRWEQSEYTRSRTKSSSGPAPIPSSRLAANARSRVT